MSLSLCFASQWNQLQDTGLFTPPLFRDLFELLGRTNISKLELKKMKGIPEVNNGCTIPSLQVLYLAGTMLLEKVVSLWKLRVETNDRADSRFSIENLSKIPDSASRLPCPSRTSSRRSLLRKCINRASNVDTRHDPSLFPLPSIVLHPHLPQAIKRTHLHVSRTEGEEGDEVDKDRSGGGV